MKSKLLLLFSAALIAVFSFSKAKADTESPGGGRDGECKAPYSNTCMVVHLPLGMSKVIKGVLTINAE
ncbi:hypothetical protein [Sphingobacterium griseoflavum]|nr:hypothetical protein [Sphingobacterium griseoflavum]